MDRVQLADTSPWKGMPHMSDTDNTYALTARASRPTALGDLRFAGTIAAGFIAGTLGLGALAAPLVGWKDWPSGLTQQASSSPLRLAKPLVPRTGNERTPRTGQPAPGGATILTSVGLPGGSAGTAGGTDGGFVSLGLGFGDSADPGAGSPGRRDRTRGATVRTTTSSGTGTGSGQFVQDVAFTNPLADDDHDGASNDFEVKNNSNPQNAADGSTTVAASGSGLSNATEFQIRFAGGWSDTNGDGFIDGNDDADGDGVSNAAEERNGTNPMLPDSNGDGVNDGLDDRDGDGYPDGFPVPATPPTPVTEPPADEPPVTLAPPVETTPIEDGTTAPPIEQAPTVPV
jgi:hypothetical protein